MDLHRLARLVHGRLVRTVQGIEGGERLEVYGPLRFSRPERGTAVVFGRWVKLYRDVSFYLDGPGASIAIGNGTYVNQRTMITCKRSAVIGENCAIGWDVWITDTDYHCLGDGENIAPVSIADRVWIGARSSILKGVSVGAGAVVAAGSVVTKDVPERALVAGNPARVIEEDVRWT